MQQKGCRLPSKAPLDLRLMSCSGKLGLLLFPLPETCSVASTLLGPWFPQASGDTFGVLPREVLDILDVGLSRIGQRVTRDWRVTV